MYVPIRPVGDYARAFAHRLFEALPYGITLEEARELRELALASVNEVMDVGTVTAFYREQFRTLMLVAATPESAALMEEFSQRELPRLATERRPRFLEATLAANRLQAYFVAHPEHPLTRAVDVENVNVTQDGQGRFTVEIPLMPGAEQKLAQHALTSLLAREEDLSSVRTVRTQVRRPDASEWGLRAA